eukprot:gene982-109_t
MDALEREAVQQPNVRFYRGHSTTQQGHLKLAQILKTQTQGGRAGDNEWLEADHNYIQWLFPTKQQGQNHLAISLSDDEVSTFKADQSLQTALTRSFDMMLAFLGFQREGPDRITTRIDWKDRFANWDAHPHNDYRITRMLTSLKLLGKQQLVDAFVSTLAEQITKQNAPQRCRHALERFWAPLALAPLPHAGANDADSIAKMLALPLLCARELVQAGWKTAWLLKAKAAHRTPGMPPNQSASQQASLSLQIPPYPPAASQVQSTFSDTAYTLVSVLPIAVGATPLQLNNSHPLHRADITVAEYCQMQHQVAVVPSGPVALLRDPQGRFVLLPAESCTHKNPSQQKPKVTLAHGAGKPPPGQAHDAKTGAAAPEVAEMISTIEAASAIMEKEGPYVVAKPAQDHPLVIVGALQGKIRILDNALQQTKGRCRLLLLGHYLSGSRDDISLLVQLASLKARSPGMVRLLRGPSEDSSSHEVSRMFQDLQGCIGSEDLALLQVALEAFFKAMPLVAKLRGQAIATASSVPCIPGASTRLTELQSDQQAWQHISQYGIAPAHLRTRPATPTQAGQASRSDIKAWLLKETTRVLFRTTSEEQNTTEVIDLDSTRRIVSLGKEKPILQANLNKGEQYTIHGLRDRTELNGKAVRLLHWEPPKQNNQPWALGDAVTYSGLLGRTCASITKVLTKDATTEYVLRLENGEERTTTAKYIQPCGEGRCLVQLLSTPEQIQLREQFLAQPRNADAMAMDTSPPEQSEHTDEHAEYYARLCEASAGGMDQDLELPPPQDLRAFLPQLKDVDLLGERCHRVPTARHVPKQLQVAIRTAIASALHIATDPAHTADTETNQPSNAEKLGLLIWRLLLTLPPRRRTDKDEDPHDRQEKEHRRLLEWMRNRLTDFYAGMWLQMLDD